jgi:hypothetical protein
MGVFPIGNKAFGVAEEVPPVDSSFVKGCSLHGLVPNALLARKRESCDSRCSIAGKDKSLEFGLPITRDLLAEVRSAHIVLPESRRKLRLPARCADSDHTNINTAPPGVFSPAGSAAKFQ